jgi:hypothetical protein
VGDRIAPVVLEPDRRLATGHPVRTLERLAAKRRPYRLPRRRLGSSGDVVVAGNHEQPLLRNLERRARSLEKLDAHRVVGRMSPVPQVAGEHHQIHRAPILLDVREVPVPLVAGDAVAERCLASRARTLGAIRSPPMQIREMNDPNNPPHTSILHARRARLLGLRSQGATLGDRAARMRPT